MFIMNRGIWNEGSFCVMKVAADNLCLNLWNLDKRFRKFRRLRICLFYSSLVPSHIPAVLGKLHQDIQWKLPCWLYVTVDFYPSCAFYENSPQRSVILRLGEVFCWREELVRNTCLGLIEAYTPLNSPVEHSHLADPKDDLYINSSARTHLARKMAAKCLPP